MTKTFTSVLGLGLLAASLYGQADKAKTDPAAGKEMDQTITGCLTEQAGNYMITPAAGDKMEVMGSADLAKHKNHTVKLTGTSTDHDGKRMLHVTKIEHVAPSCSQ